MKKGYILSRQNLFSWLTELNGSLILIGPVAKERGQTVFEKVEVPQDLHIDYCSTMLAPRKFIYPERQTLFSITREKNSYQTVSSSGSLSSMIFGIHPCDMHAISILDRTFLGDYEDSYYRRLRKETMTCVLNCNKACDKGFCSSMATGPFLRIREGYDMEMTMVKEDFLIEFGSQKGKTMVEKAKGLEQAGESDFKQKAALEQKAILSFTKRIDTEGMPQLIMRNQDHPVYKETAEARCLGCTNCTMVCPTCYCYNIEDYTSFDLKITERRRHWDSCQELNFARVHGGNFRSSRQARLRQFVTHKLATWVEQYGCFGCTGCGRCMTWCPTGIDLTEMAKRIQEDHKMGIVR